MLLVFSLIVLLFSTMLHEIAHGSVALSLGDTTAREEGRLTLNPIKHLDFFGSIMLPLMMYVFTLGQGPIFGWAKPVPINPFNLTDKKWGMLKVAIAGPAVNFLIGITFSFLTKFTFLPPVMKFLFAIVALYNFAWGIFNLIPVPPFDGSHILFTLLPKTQKWIQFRLFLLKYGFFIILAFIFLGIHYIFYFAAFFHTLISGQPILI